jgi:hypothetical protein
MNAFANGAGADRRRGRSYCFHQDDPQRHGNFHVDPTGRNIWFGVREFAMCAAVNGMAVHGGIIPYGSTFFTFSDYCKPALRLAAIMKVAFDLRLHARLDRAGRGRPDPSTDRAPDGAAGTAQDDRLPSGGRQRDRGRRGGWLWSGRRLRSSRCRGRTCRFSIRKS